MRKGKKVIGQAVVSFGEGRRIDTVKDLLIGETNDAIVALLVDEGGLMSSSRVVPIEAVQSFGRDAVVIGTAQSVTSASSDPEVKAIMNRKEHLLGKRVLTNSGDLEGTISDLYFEEETGRIQGFEVSGGMLGDIARGTSYLAVDEIERIGPDIVFIRPETGENLENQVGGVQGALQSAGGKLGEAADDAAHKAQAGLSEREPERALIGRRSGTDVTDDTGRIIVAKGQRIRAEHLEWARETDNVNVLTRAAASGQASETGERAMAGLEQAGDDISAMWDRFTARIGQMRDEHGRQVDEQQTRLRLAQIADAIGRPVGKVILDRSDNVILDFGDIVTHQAVQQAYDAGMLDTLLASIHRAEFGLPLDQLKAQQPASATVDQASGGADVVDELEQKVRESERQRAERLERERRDAEAANAQREREREERSRERTAAEQQRQREIEEARASAEGGDAGSTAGEEAPASREYETIKVESPAKARTGY